MKTSLFGKGNESTRLLNWLQAILSLPGNFSAKCLLSIQFKCRVNVFQTDKWQSETIATTVVIFTWKCRLIFIIKIIQTTTFNVVEFTCGWHLQVTVIYFSPRCKHWIFEAGFVEYLAARDSKRSSRFRLLPITERWDRAWTSAFSKYLISSFSLLWIWLLHSANSDSEVLSTSASVL